MIPRIKTKSNALLQFNASTTTQSACNNLRVYKKQRIKNKTKMILHSLNAVRVIFEYIIVNHHVNDLGSENIFSASYGSSNSLMSFFFVLSGFVAMHTTDGLDKTYFLRRLKKTYPFYLLMWLCGFPPVYYGNTQISKCPTQSWIYTALQPFCVQIFLMWKIEGSNIPDWYYSVLVFLWVAHSYIAVTCSLVPHSNIFNSFLLKIVI